MARDVANWRPKKGEMAFWWLGQLGFIVKTENSVLVFDPFLEDSPSRLIPPIIDAEDLDFADYVLGTHDHGDHIDKKAWKAISIIAPDTKFVVPAFSKDVIAKDVPLDESRMIAMNDGAVFRDEAKGIVIKAIPAAHEFLDRDPETGFYQSLGYIVEVDGLRICHTGDTCKYEGMEAKLIDAGPIDALFLPINGRDGFRLRMGIIGNMDFREAVDLAGAVKPGITVPAHYDMFAGNSENPYNFIMSLETKFPERKFWVGGHGERVVLSRDE
ncbi:MAG: MBL fold metallo-hydrolase [Clostridiales bacterium]|nr:MBL fold metallo-hydrolase [Clostridiales bacterium]